jgi:hypothetical protein
MRIHIGSIERDVKVEFVNDVEHVNAAGLETILTAWCDRPSRTWMVVRESAAPDADPHYVIARDDTGRIELTEFEPTDDGLWSLVTLDHIIPSVLRYGEGIGLPSPQVQDALIQSLRNRVGVSGSGLPEAYVDLELLVLAVVGDAGLS